LFSPKIKWRERAAIKSINKKVIKHICAMMMVIANNPELFIYRFIYYSFNFSALKYCVRIFNQQKK